MLLILPSQLHVLVAGYTAQGIKEAMEVDVRVCICHFTPEQYTKSQTAGGATEYKLHWNARPNPAQSVQVQHAPTTASPAARTVARAAETVGFPSAALALPIQPSLQQLQPWTSPAPHSAPLQSSQTTRGDQTGASKRARSPTQRMSLDAALVVIKRLCLEQSNTLIVTAADLDSTEAQCRALAQEAQQLRVQLAEFVRAATTLFDMYQLEVSAHMSTRTMLEEARRQAGLPWTLCTTDIAAVSFERLCLDPRFKSNIRAMTGFWSIEAMEAFFEVCLGFSDGVLPCRYTPGRDSISGRSTATLAEHKNYYFFVLYLLRTGAQSFMLAGMLFGLDQASASLWCSFLFFRVRGLDLLYVHVHHV